MAGVAFQASIVVDVLRGFATQFAIVFVVVFVHVGAVLDHMVFRASGASGLPGLIGKRVDATHLAIGFFIMVDGGTSLVGQKFPQRAAFALVPPLFVLVTTVATNFAFDGFGHVGEGTDVAFVLGRGFVSGTFRAVVSLV